MRSSAVMAVSLNQAIRRLLDEPNPAVLATINADGSPQTSVVWVGTDGDELVISSAAGRRKDVNIRRDPRVSLSVYDPRDPDLYAEIRGRASVTEDIDRVLAVRLAEEYEGPGAGEEYLALPAEIVRVVIRVVPEHIAGSAARLPRRAASRNTTCHIRSSRHDRITKASHSPIFPVIERFPVTTQAVRLVSSRKTLSYRQNGPHSGT
jgi:PPOX class probable F420-dependent enzyme